ncbi:uncharacterized protein B0I36DRAFT_343084 [Microdochium trichocladiopsis]|uniref:Chromo domain-containing protein n=1 Tax=Microdochium trichocladiopsis TaxID=1682393 RepID=A0A9P8XP37_9PEZI|nr:uncharacterized protein B0I36DRAFT_343084 [Microdochium trichocladiopsis]KAH7007949.1 hypothetical protein B0I36DRAFT_343084 [Microdochium trichocladiopsis]
MKRKAPASWTYPSPPPPPPPPPAAAAAAAASESSQRLSNVSNPVGSRQPDHPRSSWEDQQPRNGKAECSLFGSSRSAVECSLQPFPKSPRLGFESLPTQNVAETQQGANDIDQINIDPILADSQGLSANARQLSVHIEEHDSHRRDSPELSLGCFPSIAIRQTTSNRLLATPSAINIDQEPVLVFDEEDHELGLTVGEQISDDSSQGDFSNYRDTTATRSHSAVACPQGRPESAWPLTQRSTSPEHGHQQQISAEQMAVSKSSSVLADLPPQDTSTGTYEQWELHHGLLSRTTLGSETHFQIQFAWDHNTDGHVRPGDWDLPNAHLQSTGDGTLKLCFSRDAGGEPTKHPSKKRRRSSKTVEKAKKVKKAKKVGKAKKKQLAINTEADDEEDDQEYPVDCILEKYGRNQFLVKWMEGKPSWTTRDKIHEKLTDDFDKVFKGYGRGIELLEVRVSSKRVKEYRVKWGDDQVTWERAGRIDWSVYQGKIPSLVVKQ